MDPTLGLLRTLLLYENREGVGAIERKKGRHLLVSHLPVVSGCLKSPLVSTLQLNFTDTSWCSRSISKKQGTEILCN